MTPLRLDMTRSNMFIMYMIGLMDSTSMTKVSTPVSQKARLHCCSTSRRGFFWPTAVSVGVPNALPNKLRFLTTI